MNLQRKFRDMQRRRLQLALMLSAGLLVGLGFRLARNRCKHTRLEGSNGCAQPFLSFAVQIDMIKS
jgi:hypothetical protein